MEEEKKILASIMRGIRPFWWNLRIFVSVYWKSFCVPFARTSFYTFIIVYLSFIFDSMNWNVDDGQLMQYDTALSNSTHGHTDTHA